VPPARCSNTRTHEDVDLERASPAGFLRTLTVVTDSRVAQRTNSGPYPPQMRRLVYLSDAILVATAGVIAAFVGTGWSWWLFVWGAALGALGIAGNEFVVRVTVRVVRPAASDLERMRSRRHDQRLIVFPTSLGTGCAVGIISAGLQSAAPDVLLTVAIVVLEVGVPLAMLPWLRRRVAVIRARPTESAPSSE
jgi:small neutral amino acid transporter SnatA (MarC family)